MFMFQQKAQEGAKFNLSVTAPLRLAEHGLVNARSAIFYISRSVLATLQRHQQTSFFFDGSENSTGEHKRDEYGKRRGHKSRRGGGFRENSGRQCTTSAALSGSFYFLGKTGHEAENGTCMGRVYSVSSTSACCLKLPNVTCR